MGKKGGKGKKGGGKKGGKGKKAAEEVPPAPPPKPDPRAILMEQLIEEHSLSPLPPPSEYHVTGYEEDVEGISHDTSGEVERQNTPDIKSIYTRKREFNNNNSQFKEGFILPSTPTPILNTFQKRLNPSSLITIPKVHHEEEFFIDKQDMKRMWNAIRLHFEPIFKLSDPNSNGNSNGSKKKNGKKEDTDGIFVYPEAKCMETSICDRSIRRQNQTDKTAYETRVKCLSPLRSFPLQDIYAFLTFRGEKFKRPFPYDASKWKPIETLLQQQYFVKYENKNIPVGASFTSPASERKHRKKAGRQTGGHIQTSGPQNSFDGVVQARKKGTWKVGYDEFFLALQSSDLRRVCDMCMEDPSWLNWPNREMDFPLHIAVIKKDVYLLHLLLIHQACVNCPAMDGSTPLHYAVANGDVQIVTMLLEYGADIYARDVYNTTPLHLAASYLHSPEHLNGEGKYNSSYKFSPPKRERIFISTSSGATDGTGTEATGATECEGGGPTNTNNTANTSTNTNTNTNAITNTDMAAPSPVGNVSTEEKGEEQDIGGEEGVGEEAKEKSQEKDRREEIFQRTCKRTNSEELTKILLRYRQRSEPLAPNIHNLSYVKFQKTANASSFPLPLPLSTSPTKDKDQEDISNIYRQSKEDSNSLESRKDTFGASSDNGYGLRTFQKGNTPLHYACKGGHIETVRQLIEKKTPMFVLNEEQLPPLLAPLALSSSLSEDTIKEGDEEEPVRNPATCARLITTISSPEIINSYTEYLIEKKTKKGKGKKGKGKKGKGK